MSDLTDHLESLQGRRIFLFGKLGSMSRREARAHIQSAGGRVVDSLDEPFDLAVISSDCDIDIDSMTCLAEQPGSHRCDSPVEKISEAQFYQILSLNDDEGCFQKYYTPAMLAELLGIPSSTVRRWHRRGLIHSIKQVKGLPYFDFLEVASARRISKLIASVASPNQIEAQLVRLSRLAPELRRPLSQLSVIVEGNGLLVRKNQSLIEPNGQMRLDFTEELPPDHSPQLLRFRAADNGYDDHEQRTDSVVEKNFDVSTGLATPDEFIRHATKYEEQQDVESAIEVYRAMMLAFGPTADTCFRLAELLYRQSDLPAARERYYMTIELDETFVEARASLGCVLVEMNQPELALAAFQGALLHHPEYPDVHFYMGRLLDDLDRLIEAEHHWNYFLKLAPNSPWADEARERLGGQVF